MRRQAATARSCGTPGLVVALRLGAGALCGCSAAAAAPASGLAFHGDWRLLETGDAARTASALAIHARSGAIVFGDAHGVFALEADGNTRLRLRRGPVRDLAFLDAQSQAAPPALIAATARGLYHLDAEGRATAVSLGPGAAARGIARLAVAPGLIAAAGEDGVFVSANGIRWRRLDGLPAGPAQAVALRAVAGGYSCISASGEELWRSFVASLDRGSAEPGSEAAISAVSRRLDSAVPGEGAVVDLALEVGGAALVALRGGALAALGADGRWSRIEPALAPGVLLRRLLAAGDEFWLATDRGIAAAPALAGPWRFAQGIAARVEVQALAAHAQRVYAATSAGILVSGGAASLPARPALAARPGPPASLPMPAEPEISELHLAAIDYLGLRREGIEALARGVRSRGWLPVVTLHGDYQRDRDRGADQNQSFSAGEIRQLQGRDWGDGRKLGLALVASWDLGDLAYHPESIDVEKEARERIELRDDVLDELNQLYFERRRVLGELALEADPESPVALRMRVRAEELAAGIDGWTGGWFSRRLAAAATHSPGPRQKRTP